MIDSGGSFSGRGFASFGGDLGHSTRGKAKVILWGQSISLLERNKNESCVFFCRFGQFIVATLTTVSEKNLVLRDGEGITEGEGENILLRNQCLQTLHGLLFVNSSNGSKINTRFL